MKFETDNEPHYIEELYDGELQLDGKEYPYKIEKVYDGIDTAYTLDWMVEVPVGADEIEILILEDFENGHL